MVKQERSTLQEIWNIDPGVFSRERTLSDKIRFLLQYAILAPSTHNSQPWRFEITANSCRFHLDPARRLPEADPTGRDRAISLGCCLENFIIAATHFGIFKEVKYAADEKEGVVVDVMCEDQGGAGQRDKENEYLVAAITKRRNVRGIFNNKRVPPEMVEKLAGLGYDERVHAHFVEDPEAIKKLAALTAQGLRKAYGSPAFRKEVSAWMHPNSSRSRDGILGHSLRMSTPVSFILPKLIRYFDISKKLAYLNFASMVSAPVVCVITAEEDLPALWVKTGRLAERIMLECNAENLRTSIFVAAIEMDNLSTKIQEVLGTHDTPQFMFCIGFMDSPQPLTPRFLVEEKLL